MSTLDYTKLLQLQTLLSTLSSVGVAPPYNLPVFLYGLATQSSGPEHSINFTALLAFSFVLDILWLILWRKEYSSFTAFLMLANLAAKPVTFLAMQSNRPAFAGIGDDAAGQTIWSMPGGFTSSQSNTEQASAAQPSVGSYQGGYRFADDEEEDAAPKQPADTKKGYQSV